MTLKTDLQRAFTSWGLIAGIAGMAAAVFFGAFEQMIPIFTGQMKDGLMAGFSIELVLTALKSDVLLLVLPILCALPFTPAFVDDMKSRYLREYLPRAGRTRYIVSRVAATALSGGAVLFAGIMLVSCVFMLIFMPMELAPLLPDTTAGFAPPIEEIDISAQVTFADLMGRAFTFFLSGCLWSLIGGTFATVTMSKYMAYASPFIFYYVLVILSQRFFQDVYVLDPQQWLNPSEGWAGGVWGVALLLGELIAIVSVLYGMLMQRRMQDV